MKIEPSVNVSEKEALMSLNYSVLMSVYARETPEYLKKAIDSMINQTVPTNDFVLVCDGPLTDDLDRIIVDFQNKCPNLFNIIRLPQNQGLGHALNIGLKSCKHDLVARMDSDDISLPERCQLQLNMFQREPELALCSGNIAEFETDITHITGIRYVPTSYGEILQFAKKRNPMNHMAVMYRKHAVINCGNYVEMSLAEDYYLWARMLHKGYYAINLDKVLVYARIGNGMYARRGGLAYARKIYALQKKLLQIQFISLTEFIFNCIVRILSSMVPIPIRKIIYLKKLRNRVEE